MEIKLNYARNLHVVAFHFVALHFIALATEYILLHCIALHWQLNILLHCNAMKFWFLDCWNFGF